MTTAHSPRSRRTFAVCTGLALTAMVTVLTAAIATAQIYDPRRKPVPAAAAKTIRPVHPPNLQRRAAPRIVPANRAVIGAPGRPGYPSAMGLRRPAATTAAQPTRAPMAGARRLGA